MLNSNETTASIFDIRATGADKVVGFFADIGGSLKEMLTISKKSAEAGGVVQSVVGTKAQKEQATGLLKEVESGIQNLTKAQMQLNQSLIASTTIEEFEKTEKELAKINKQVARLQGIKATIKIDVDDDTGRLDGGRSTENAFQLEPVSQFVSQISGSGAISDAADGLSEFISKAKDMGASAKEIGTIGRDSFNLIVAKVQELRAASKTGAGGMGGLIGAINPLGIGIAALGAGLAIVSQAANDYNQSLFRQREEYRLARQEARNEVQAQQEIRDLITNGDYEGAQARLNSLNQTIEQVSADISLSSDQVDAALAQYNQTLQENGSASMFATGNMIEQAQLLYNTFVVQSGQWSNYQELLKEMLPLSSEFNELLSQRAEIEAALSDIETARNAREAQQRLADAEEELTTLRQQAQEVANNLADSEAEAYRQREQQEAELQETNRRADFLAQRDFRREEINAANEHSEALIDIEKATAKSVEDARAEYQDSEIKAKEAHYEALMELDEELAESIADAQSEFMESEIKAAESHAKQMAKAEEQYGKERVKRMRDLLSELRDAEFNNDIVAFINAQRGAEKDLGDMDESFKDGQSESSQQYIEERAEARKALDEQLADLRANSAERRAEMAEQYAEERDEAKKAFEERLDQLKADGERQREEEIARYNEARADAKRAYDQRRKDEEEQRRYDRNLRQAAFRQQLLDLQQAAINQLKTIQIQEAQKMLVIQSGGAYQVQQVRYTALATANEFISAINMMRSSLAGGFGTPGSGPFKTPGKLQTGIGGIGASNVNLSFGNVNLGGVAPAQFAAAMTALQQQVVNGIRAAATQIRPGVYT